MFQICISIKLHTNPKFIVQIAQWVAEYLGTRSTTSNVKDTTGLSYSPPGIYYFPEDFSPAGLSGLELPTSIFFEPCFNFTRQVVIISSLILIQFFFNFINILQRSGYLNCWFNFKTQLQGTLIPEDFLISFRRTPTWLKGSTDLTLQGE